MDRPREDGRVKNDRPARCEGVRRRMHIWGRQPLGGQPRDSWNAGGAVPRGEKVVTGLRPTAPETQAASGIQSVPGFSHGWTPQWLSSLKIWPITALGGAELQPVPLKLFHHHFAALAMSNCRGRIVISAIAETGENGIHGYLPWQQYLSALRRHVRLGSDVPDPGLALVSLPRPAGILACRCGRLHRRGS